MLPRLQVSDLTFSNSDLFFSRIVTETTFTSECENIVQHICEEHYHVPVPVPTHVHQPPPHVPFGPAPNPNGRRRRRRRRKKRSGSSVEQNRRKRASSLEKQELILGLKQALGVPPPPTVFHQELPAPPGCRSLVTQKCHKVESSKQSSPWIFSLNIFLKCIFILSYHHIS